MSIRTEVLSNLLDSVPIPQAFDAKLQNLFREVVQMNLSVIHSVRAAEPFRDSLPVPFERDEGVVQLGIASVVNATRKRLIEGSSSSCSVGKRKKRDEYPSLLPEKISSKSVKSDSKKRARDGDDDEYRAPKTRYKHAIDVYILQAKLNPDVWKNIPNGENELDARIGVGSGTTILTNQTIYNHSVDDLLSRLDVEEESCVAKGSDE